MSKATTTKKRAYKKNRKKLSPLDKAYKSYSIQFSRLGNAKDENGKSRHKAQGRRLTREEFEQWAMYGGDGIDLNDEAALLEFARNRAARDYNLITTEQATNLKREMVVYMSTEDLKDFFGLTRDEVRQMTVAEIKSKAFNDKKLLSKYYHYLKEKKGKTAEDARETISCEIFGSE